MNDFYSAHFSLRKILEFLVFDEKTAGLISQAVLALQNK
jgi:hypothetical protein